MSDSSIDTSNFGQSPDPAAERRAQLAVLIPEAFSEGRLDVSALKRALGGEALIEGGERYALTWAGKANAYKVLQTPSSATLRPQRDLSVNFDEAQHVFIEGENLEVLKVLQKAYFGKVKLIYIDPPYNTGSDSFIYPDRFQESKEDYLRRINDLSDDGTLMREGFFRKNSKESGHYHSNWLSMMLPRLYIARNLLREDGVIFISCDDNELHNLRALAAEVFGEENIIGLRVWEKGTKSAKLIGITHEYMLGIARNKAALQELGVWRKRKDGVDEVLSKYRELREQYGNDHAKIEEAIRGWFSSLPKKDPRRAHEHYKCSDDRGLYFPDNFHGPDDGRESRPRYKIEHPITKKPCKVPSTGWRWEESRTKKALGLKPPLIHFGPDHSTIPCRKSYLHVVDSGSLQSVFYKDGRAGTLVVEKLVGKGVFDFPKDIETLRELVEVVLNPRPKKAAWSEDDEDDSSIEPPRFDEVVLATASDHTGDAPIVLDFFAGSGSTAHAVFDAELRGTHARFVSVQLPEPTDRGGFNTVAEVARARISKVITEINDTEDLLSKPPKGLGFKSFLLTPSNFKQWRGDGIETPEQLAEQMQMFANSEKEGAAVEHMLYELLLKFGQELTTPVEALDVAGGQVYAIHGRKMLFVLDTFTDAMIQPLVDMKPREIIATDGVFHDSDPLKSNLDLQCRDAGIKFTCL
jgi:adenine-specific DNA-methyltransferase